MSDTTTTPTTFDPRDLEPPRRRVSDLQPGRDDISAIAYGRLCGLLAAEQRRLASMTAGSRFDWARVDGRCQALAEACALFSGVDADELRRRLTPVDHERRAR